MVILWDDLINTISLFGVSEKKAKTEKSMLFIKSRLISTLFLFKITNCNNFVIFITFIDVIILTGGDFMTEEQLNMIISYIEVNHDILTTLDILEGLYELRENNRKEKEI